MGLSYLFLLYFGDCYVSLVVCVLVLRCVGYVLLDLLTVVCGGLLCIGCWLVVLRCFDVC